MPELIIPPEKLVFIPLGGASEVGMNFFLYGYKGKWLIVDCGIGFPGDGLPGVDTLLPNPAFISQYKKDIVGLFITHAHEDHIGGVARLWKDLQCPIFVTPFANEVLEGKLAEQGLLGRADVQVVETNSIVELDPFEVTFITMNHSVPEPNALAIRTDQGVVLHTGDWKFDSNPLIGDKADLDALAEMGKAGVLAMVCDSTNIFGEKSDRTEADVKEALIKVIGEYPGKQIAVGCFASNIVRIRSIYEAAVKSGRQVCLLGRSLWRLDAAARATGYMEDIPEFLTEDEAVELPHGKVLYICTGSQGEPFSALNNLASPTPSRGSVNLEPGDVVIFSSRVIPGNEKSIGFLQKRLRSKGLKIITDKEAPVHVSGHYAGEDLEKMYELVKPKIALPVHGETMELLAHVDLALKYGAEFAFALEEGEVIALDDTPQILGEIFAGVLAVDGKKILGLDAEVIKKRRKMMEGGSMVITLVLDGKGSVMGEPKISAFGLLDAGPEDTDKLTALIYKAVSNMPADKAKNDEHVQNTVRGTIRQFLAENYGKKPLIEVHLIRI